MYCEFIKRNKSIMYPFRLYSVDVGHRQNYIKSLFLFYSLSLKSIKNQCSSHMFKILVSLLNQFVANFCPIIPVQYLIFHTSILYDIVDLAINIHFHSHSLILLIKFKFKLESLPQFRVLLKMNPLLFFPFSNLF